MDEDKLSLTKAVSGIANPKNFVKLGVQDVNIGLLVLVVLGCVSIWNFFFPRKAQTQRQTSNVVFSKDSGVDKVTIINRQDQDQPKKNVGIEIAASTKDIEPSLMKYFNDHAAAGIGARWKFENPSNGDSRVEPIIKLRWDF